jgi:hypothetical protein
MDEHPCGGPVTEGGPRRAQGPYCPVACPRCKATCQMPLVYHQYHWGYDAGHLHSWAD